jgi:hypothetical protein
VAISIIVRELVYFDYLGYSKSFCNTFHNSKIWSSWTVWRSKLAIFRVTVSIKVLGRECLLAPAWRHFGNSSKQKIYSHWEFSLTIYDIIWIFMHEEISWSSIYTTWVTDSIKVAQNRYFWSICHRKGRTALKCFGLSSHKRRSRAWPWEANETPCLHRSTSRHVERDVNHPPQPAVLGISYRFVVYRI